VKSPNSITNRWKTKLATFWRMVPARAARNVATLLNASTRVAVDRRAAG